jgi:uncharacterized ferritin-like protein (DUF455 family)
MKNLQVIHATRYGLDDQAIRRFVAFFLQSWLKAAVERKPVQRHFEIIMHRLGHMGADYDTQQVSRSFFQYPVEDRRLSVNCLVDEIQGLAGYQ